MSDQECALHGELVRYLRDRCVSRLAELERGKPETARAWIDGVIREWFFTPQEDLHGDTPRDIIWRERGANRISYPKITNMRPFSTIAQSVKRCKGWRTLASGIGGSTMEETH